MVVEKGYELNYVDIAWWLPMCSWLRKVLSFFCFLVGGDDDLGDEGGTRMSRPEGTTEENSPESEEGQPGAVCSFDLDTDWLKYLCLFIIYN